MYCTGGIRCERASSYLKTVGLENVNQLEGGIHRYLDAYPEDGGHWIGQNYTFDKRFSHGAKKCDVVGKCTICNEPWERY
jgi:predicted sulfurtransferase